jgi:hypothetical protein
MSKQPREFTVLSGLPGRRVERFRCRTRQELQTELQRFFVEDPEFWRLVVNELWRGRIAEITGHTLLVVPGDFDVSTLDVKA